MHRPIYLDEWWDEGHVLFIVDPNAYLDVVVLKCVLVAG